MKEVKLNTGLSSQARKKVVTQLAAYLADTYVLYTKTQVFHWNVVGPEFGPLHKLFEGQYEALAGAADELAERIRSLGFLTPSGLKEMLKLSSLKESSGERKASQMIKELLEDNEHLVRLGAKLITLANEAGDNTTADMITQRVSYHEKTAWMLRSSL